jgi:glyceraldehyde 3-phosphate dehydrogenase
MTMKRVAINGMGRTGRVMLRKLLHDNDWDIELVAINDVVDAANIAYLVKYDSVHGRLDADVRAHDTVLNVGDRQVRVCQERDPDKLPWRELGIDVVIDCTGQFTDRAAAARHIEAGATRVLIAAPASDADVTLVYGVNEAAFDPGRHRIVSNASCTTNSIAPVLKLLLDRYGIEDVLATTIHAYTASQGIVDKAAKKMHRGRAAALSMIPTSTGADKATVTVLPALEGRIRVLAVRVPTPNVSLTDVSVRLSRPSSARELNALCAEAADGPLRGIVGYTDEELVSVDLVGDTRSGIVHGGATMTAGSLAKLLIWYDNEVGYACRCLDVIGRLPF